MCMQKRTLQDTACNGLAQPLLLPPALLHLPQNGRLQPSSDPAEISIDLAAGLLMRKLLGTNRCTSCTHLGMVASSSSMISALCSTPLVAWSWLVCGRARQRHARQPVRGMPAAAA